MTDSIKKYLSETPETLTRLLNNSKDLFKEVSHQDIKRIIVTGSGTSYHSGAEMQQLMREKSGILVEAYYPFMITRDLFKFDTSKTLLVGVSQGGSSFTTLDAMKIAKEKGCKIATISADKPAYIDQVADYPLTIDIGRELAGPKTEG
ncbi:SIS domain-containing protein [Lactobacillus amylovorus]|nr:SIS domain-containing protein [Lactobacillus amylovorus]RGW81523.1 SIS domain-containing protein [Lactobacillus amylovorus]